MKLTVFTLCLVLALGSTVVGADPSPQLQAAADPSLTASTGAETPAGDAGARTPLMEEISALLESEQTRLILLYEQFDASHSETDALAIQKQIEDLKRTTEIGVLQVQLRHARLEDRREAVLRLERALLEMQDGPEVAH
jgi:hypothetical protein